MFSFCFWLLDWVGEWVGGCLIGMCGRISFRGFTEEMGFSLKLEVLLMEMLVVCDDAK